MAGVSDQLLAGDEKRIILIIRTMLAETDFCVSELDDLRKTARHPNVGVLRDGRAYSGAHKNGL